MLISEIMHEGVISVNINDTIKKVATIMREEDIGAVPVMEEGKPVGFVTDRDIVISCVADGHSANDPIAHAMTEELVTIEKDSDAEEAARLMQENKVSRLLVLENEKPIGIVSLQNISTALKDDQLGQTVNSIKS